ncbi:DUF6176 family protein [Halobaculum sp. MBLA0147]|uniref:DUF6176 family protein n=1 Tax=Halobaculum sp. MBLA0147 TaxID=3079934 RepID=UPI0035262D80
MADVALTKQRVAPDRVDRLREWMAEVKTRESEALETLAHEGMVAEAAFLDEGPEETYLFYYMEAEDVDAVHEAFESSPYEIDREHAAVLREVAAEEQPDEQPELLYHLVDGDAAREQDGGFSPGGVEPADAADESDGDPDAADESGDDSTE